MPIVAGGWYSAGTVFANGMAYPAGTLFQNGNSIERASNIVPTYSGTPYYTPTVIYPVVGTRYYSSNAYRQTTYYNPGYTTFFNGGYTGYGFGNYSGFGNYNGFGAGRGYAGNRRYGNGFGVRRW